MNKLHFRPDIKGKARWGVSRRGLGSNIYTCSYAKKEVKKHSLQFMRTGSRHLKTDNQKNQHTQATHTCQICELGSRVLQKYR